MYELLTYLFFVICFLFALGGVIALILLIFSFFN